MRSNFAPQVTLTLSNNLVGSTVIATLGSGYWYDVASIRSGFRILEVSGSGEATIIDRPKYRSREIEVEIKSVFTSISISSGEWELSPDKAIDITRYIPSNYEGTELLPKLMEVFEDSSLSEAGDSASRLLDLRSWSNVEPEYLDEFIKLLGLFIDTTSFSEEEKRRVIQAALHFYRVSGTKSYINFLGYIKDALFEMEQLYTTNYVEFIGPSDQGFTDSHYPTNHIRLKYDAESFDVDSREVPNLFYQLAPIHDVLEQVVAALRGLTKITFGITSHSYHHIIGYNNLDKDFTFSHQLILGSTGHSKRFDFGYINSLLEVSFAQATYNVTEGSTVNVVLSLNRIYSSDLTISFTFSGGASSTDYSFPSSVVFSTGESTKSLQFSAVDDIITENEETVNIGLGTLPTPLNTGSHSTTSVLIAASDQPIDVIASFAQAAYSVTEGSSVSVTVNLDTDPQRTVVIPLSYLGASSSDYTSPNSVTFNSGETTKTISFQATDDTLIEGAEAITVSFGTLPSNTSAGTQSTTVVTIAASDQPIDVVASFAQATYSVTEGSSVNVVLNLDTDPQRTVTIPISYSGASSNDYTSPSSVTFNSGETTKTISFQATDDTLTEGAEAVTVSFGTLPTNVTLGTQTTTVVTIAASDQPIDVVASFAQATYSVSEGNSVNVVLNLDTDPQRSVTLPILATGASTSDYNVASSVTFNTGETTKNLSFQAVDDPDSENAEAITLSLGTLPNNTSAGTQSTTVVTIAASDQPIDVVASFAQATYSVSEGNSVNVVLNLDTDPQRTVVIPITVAGASPSDYVVANSITFNSGETTKNLSFQAVDDPLIEGAEDVTLSLGTLPNNTSAGTQSTTIVTIAVSDQPIVVASFAQATYSVSEGNSVNVVLNLDTDPQRTVVIPITVAGASPSDYVVASSVTFNTGETTKNLSFQAVDDTLIEGAEAITLSLGTLPNNTSAGTQSTTVVTIAASDQPIDVVASFAQAAYSVTEGSSVNVVLNLDTDPQRTVIIPISATGASPSDYVVANSITFNSGETTKNLSFQAVDDPDSENAEAITLSLGTLPSNTSAGTQSTTIVTIAASDQYSISNFSAMSELSGLQFSWTGSSGLDYRIENSTTVAGTYSSLTTITGSTNTNVTYTRAWDTTVVGNDFFRVVGYDSNRDRITTSAIQPTLGFDTTGLTIELAFLATATSGTIDQTTTNQYTLFSTIPRSEGNIGLLQSGERGISTAETVLTRIAYNYDTDTMSLNDSDTPMGLVLRDYFRTGGAGADATWYLETSAGRGSVPANDYTSIGGGFINYHVGNTLNDIFESITSGSEFYLVLARTT